MLRVKIELLPGGDSDRARLIGQVLIANVSDLANESDYAVAVTEHGNPRLGISPSLRTFMIEGHDRYQSILVLLQKVFDQALDAEIRPLAPTGCIKVCSLDENNVCIGCNRTIDEIKQAGLNP